MSDIVADRWRYVVEPDSDGVWFSVRTGDMHGGTFLTPAQARALAAMLVEAAEAAEPAQVAA